VLEGLIDHAAMFPPASMGLSEALEEDRRARAGDAAGVIGRFVVPASALAELPPDGPPLSVVLRGIDEAALVAGVARVEAVELPLGAPRPRSRDLVAAYRELQPLGADAYFELVLDESWRDSVPAAVGALAAIRGRAKLRCGGATVPSVEQVALVIACCREAGVRFKATAGLHHAVRRGGEHGFLNLMAAVTAPRDRLTAVLAEEDPAALEVDERSRDLFDGFGSCSWREPVDDLRELGVLR
jgi:hypothetical protein